jgi:Putative heavy-metal-binding
MLITTTPRDRGPSRDRIPWHRHRPGRARRERIQGCERRSAQYFGGRAKSYENELASGVSDALDEMEKQAAKLGADAVVGVDVDYESVGATC